MKFAGWVAAGVLLASSRASAQDPFTLDPVMVTWIYGDTPALKDIAYDLRTDLESLIYGSYLVVPLSTVPDYDDYDAETYLDSCRDDGRVECGYVIAARGRASWAVVGELDASSPGRPPQLLLSVVDVEGAREVMSFTSAVTIDNHQAIADGLSLVLDQVLAGGADLSDDRQVGRDMWELRQEGRQERQEQADAIDRSGELDDLTRTIVQREDERISVDDLAEYEGREDGTPWERVGLGQREYVRYQNSGKTLAEWRRMRKGRLGTIRLRALGGFGSGPYHHVYDGRYVLSADSGSFEPVAVESFQVLENGGGATFGLELGLGILPWLDVHAGIATRGIRYRGIVYQEVQNEPGTVPRPIEVAQSTVEYTFGAEFSPLPTYGIRPIAAAQLVIWQGRSVDKVFGLPPALSSFPTPNGVFLRIAPGVELQAGKHVVLFSRVNVNARLAGSTLEEEISGGNVLIQRAELPERPGALGFDWMFGIDVPVGPLFGKGD